MNAFERRSLSVQIVRSYAANLQAERPLDLQLTGIRDALLHPDQLPCDGSWRQWDAIPRSDLTAEECWPTHQLVWLTPDATRPLLDLPEPGKGVLVIGGIIDRAVIKGLTASRAHERRIQARRLPLREFAPKGNVHPILAPFMVVQILAAGHSGMTWEAAIEVGLPRRFVKRREKEAFFRAEQKALKALRREAAGGGDGRSS